MSLRKIYEMGHILVPENHVLLELVTSLSPVTTQRTLISWCYSTFRLHMSSQVAAMFVGGATLMAYKLLHTQGQQTLWNIYYIVIWGWLINRNTFICIIQILGWQTWMEINLNTSSLLHKLHLFIYFTCMTTLDNFSQSTI